MKNKRISKILGWGLTTGLIFASLAAVFASPAAAGEMEWTLENTPSWEDLVILPASDIIDYDIGGNGDIIYVVLELNSECTEVGWDDPANGWENFALVKSTDGGVTWSDITDNVQDAANLPDPDSDDDFFATLVAVSVAPDDEDWVAVVGYDDDTSLPMVVASQDGGSNFTYTGDTEDTSEGTAMRYIYDLDVSPEVDGIHNIALAGMTDMAVVGFGQGSIFRLKAGTWLTGSWEDTAQAYDGWDDGIGAAPYLDNPPFTEGVVACEFSPNFDMDDTIVCMGIVAEDDVNGIPYIQSGIWESGGGDWNSEAGFSSAISVESNGDTLLSGIYDRSLGLALPTDYDGSTANTRSFFIYVNAFNVTTELVGGYIFRVDNADLSPACGPSGDPLLASIDVHGVADTGKMMIGEYVQWDQCDEFCRGHPIEADCCTGVRVWHTEELDFCCPQWDSACKDPSGPYLALVMYTPNGEKSYATTSGTVDEEFFGGSSPIEGDIPLTPNGYGPGTPLDESAFSVSLDDGISFNQVGLIDTDIDQLVDVAVCPDCSVIYLSTINQHADNSGDYPCISDDCGTDSASGYCDCDSVWRSYDNGDTWERVFHGDWEGPPLLRLPCDTTEECCTVYLGIQGTDQMFYSRDCGQCWSEPQATKIEIQDFAIESENIAYVINDAGEFSMSTQYGRRWTDAVDTGLDSGHSIAACCEQGFIVIGGFGDDAVAWSDDGGEFWNITDDLPGTSSQRVHVACDPVCENIVYAALCSAPNMGGIYRTDLTDGSWDDLNVGKFPYYGIAVAREGTLYAASDAIGVDESKDLCEDGRFTTSSVDNYYSGVARNLDPCETACCGTEDWDYLICGMGGSPSWTSGDKENFDAEPTSLKLCGCLSMDTNTVLWAIDTDPYDVRDGSGDNDPCGGLWSYEDCAAKQGITLMSPADGDVIDCDPCASCEGAPFTLIWERMCNACSYDIQIMDEEGNVIVEWVDEEITGNPPSLYVDELGIQCGNTYTWHVRMANTDCECVHSPWSETWSFTIAVGAYDAIKLLSPANGDSGISTMGVGFSWTSVPDADSYQFVLAPNADLTGAMVSQTTSDTANNFTGSLDNETVYYWQVKAFKGDVLLTTSSTGVFTTALAPVEPHDPVVVQVPPDQIIEIPPAEQITPTWIYAVIGIGAALIVVVIVLIVRTRRP